MGTQRGGVIFFSGTRFPVEHRAEVSGLQSPGRACLTWLRSRGQPTGLASLAKANTGNAKQTSTSGHLICSGWQGEPASPSNSVSVQGMLSRQACPPGLHPRAGGARQTHRRPAGSKRSRVLTWTAATGCCWDPVSRSCSFENCKGSTPLRSRGKETDGQTELTPRRRHYGD